MRAEACPTSSEVLENRPQRRAEKAFHLASLFVAQLADVRVHGGDAKPCERLRPFVAKFFQPEGGVATWSRVLPELEAGPVVIVVHPVLPPLDRNLLSASRTKDPLEVLSAVEKLNPVRDGDLNLIGIRRDGLKPFDSVLLRLGIGHEVRILGNERDPVV